MIIICIATILCMVVLLVADNICKKQRKQSSASSLPKTLNFQTKLQKT